MVENLTSTIAYIGGERRYPVGCALPLPDSCTSIQIGKERLLLAGRRFKDGFGPVTVEREAVNTKLRLLDRLLKETGRLGVIVTAEGKAYYNLGWLGQYKSHYLIPKQMRGLLRWFYHFPIEVFVEHPKFFADSQKPISLN